MSTESWYTIYDFVIVSKCNRNCWRLNWARILSRQKNVSFQKYVFFIYRSALIVADTDALHWHLTISNKIYIPFLPWLISSQFYRRSHHRDYAVLLLSAIPVTLDNHPPTANRRKQFLTRNLLNKQFRLSYQRVCLRFFRAFVELMANRTVIYYRRPMIGDIANVDGNIPDNSIYLIFSCVEMQHQSLVCTFDSKQSEHFLSSVHRKQYFCFIKNIFLRYYEMIIRKFSSNKNTAQRQYFQRNNKNGSLDVIHMIRSIMRFHVSRFYWNKRNNSATLRHCIHTKNKIKHRSRYHTMFRSPAVHLQFMLASPIQTERRRS